MSDRITAYSPDTDTNYPSWAALLEAESNGYAAVATVTRGSQTFPYVEGPFDDEATAKKWARSLRRRMKADARETPGMSVKVSVRPLWKGEHQSRAAVMWLHRRLHKMTRKVDGHGHLTATDDEKWEVEYLRDELHRKGYDATRHLMANERNNGWGWLPWFYDLETGEVRE